MKCKWICGLIQSICQVNDHAGAIQISITKTGAVLNECKVAITAKKKTSERINQDFKKVFFLTKTL